MGFEKFTGGGRSYRTRISIRSNGQIGFSQGAIHKFKMDGFSNGILFYDKEENKVGIKLGNDDNEEGACKLQIKPENAAISAKSFLDYYEIPYKETISYEAKWDETHQMIVADLNKKEI